MQVCFLKASPLNTGIYSRGFLSHSPLHFSSVTCPLVLIQCHNMYLGSDSMNLLVLVCVLIAKRVGWLSARGNTLYQEECSAEQKIATALLTGNHSQTSR